MLGEKKEESGRSHVAMIETDTLSCKELPHGDIQIGRNGLNQDISVSQ